MAYMGILSESDQHVSGALHAVDGVKKLVTPLGAVKYLSIMEQNPEPGVRIHVLANPNQVLSGLAF